jgi:hypothetical protein
MPPTSAVPNPTTASAEGTARARQGLPCELAVWTDLKLASREPTLKAARDRLIRSDGEAALEVARAAGVDIESATRSATLCENRNEGTRSRSIVFAGDYELAPLHQFRAEGGQVEPGQLLAAYPPFVFKESADGVHLRAIPSLERRRFLAELAQQIRDVPEGGTVKFPTKFSEPTE